MLLAGAACSAPVVQGPVTDIRLLSERAVLLEIPVEKGPTPNRCGVSPVEMLTRFHGRPLGEREAAGLRAELDRDGAVRISSIEAALKASGYEVAVFSGALDHSQAGLFHHLDLGRPLVVLAGPEGRKGRYLLVTGYDPERGLTVVLDPDRGMLAYPNQTLEGSWAGNRHATILAIPVSRPDPGEKTSKD